MSNANRPWKGVVVLLITALVVILIGCGGSSGGGGGLTVTGGGTTATTGTTGAVGTLEYTVAWPVAPPRSRALPSYALSVIISVYNFGTTDIVAQTIVDRTQPSAYNVNVTFNLPPGKYTVTAEAKPNLDGGGDTIASESVTSTVTDGQTTSTTLDFTNLVAQLFIDDLPPQATVGQTIQVTAHAEDSDSNAIQLPPAALDWSIISGSSFASITSDGKLTLMTPGSVTIQVREIDTDITTTKTITLIQGTTNGVIVIVS